MLTAATGYFAVIIPELGFWQGFYLIPVADTDEKMAVMRRIHDNQPDADDEPRIHRPTPGVPMEDQMFFGALQASLIDRIVARDMSGIAQFAPMIAKLASTTYFWIEAEFAPSGIITKFGRLSATSIDTARNAIRALPAVRALTGN